MVDPSEAEDQREGIAPGLETPAAASEAPRTLEQNGSGGGVTAEGEESSAEPEHHSELSSESIQQQSQPREQSPKLHLDLFNFDSPDAEGSRYVLTSPRSLEACARCSVKPVELLPRSLSDFAREAPGRSMCVATGLFEVYERDRHAKLKQCREERERIVREERRQIIQASVISKSSTTSSVERSPAAANTGSGLPSKTVLTGSSLPSKTILTGTDLPSKTALSGSSLPSKTILTGPVLPSKTVITGSDFPSKTAITGSNHLPKTVLNGSNLLSRTAPASSVPTSKTALTGYGKRSKTIHIVSELKSPSAQPSTVTSQLTCPTMTKSVSSGPAAKKVTPPIVKTHNTFPRSTSKPTSSVPRVHTSLTTAASNSSVQVTVANSAASCNGVRVAPFTHINGYSGYKLKKQDKSPSLESLQRRREPTCSSTTTTTTTTTRTSSESGASSSYSWDGQRDRWAKASSPRARTLATFNSLLGRSLSLGDLSHSPQTTQKVERIVKEVKRRGLKAVPERDRKIAALMLAKYQEEDIRSQTRYVAHLQWDSERRLEELRRECEDREKQRAVLQCQRAWQSQVSTRQQRLTQQEQETAATRLRHVAESEEKWREMAEQQERSRQQRLQQAAREGKQKKVLQEQNLRALEEERAAVLEQEQLLLQEKLTMAELKKQEREHQAQEERRGLNRAEKRRHAALRREIARREAEELELARKTMEEKLNRSSEKYEQIVERRSQELREKARREERQIQKARRAAERRERQQQEQLEARTKEAERRAQQAALVAEERAREKSLRAGLSRQEKEKLQRINRQRVEEEEQQRRLELLQSIERKLEKSEQIFREKRAVLESARSVAQASFHMRDRVREETNMRTFDKMALEAKLKASLDEK